MNSYKDALSFVCLLVAEVYESAEDENPILNLGELQLFRHLKIHYLHIITVILFNWTKCNIMNIRKTFLLFFEFKHYLWLSLGSDANLFEGDILIPVS